ncbi:MAG: hypothetical protein NTU58_04420 [Candidatus Nealsonbacteria bacterium]|nr:hypothetical protein [Candidatus Nealsonbacteria bacterium]
MEEKKEPMFKLPKEFNIIEKEIQELRCGENPHQKGWFLKSYPLTDEPCISNAMQIQIGEKEFSFTNILDANIAIECIKEFPDKPACVIIKHATPCGIALADTSLQAWEDAYTTDTKSPYGGIVAFNRTLSKEVGQRLSKQYLEVIIAPDYSQEALSIFSSKKKLRLLELPGLDKKIKRKGLEFRSVVGGFIVQERDVKPSNKNDWKVVTENKPDETDLNSMDFAVNCVKHIKSNSVVFVKGTRTVGIGGGQTSRVDAVQIATHKGGDNINGSIMASDAFFPFRDGVDAAADFGVKIIVQPGGSKKDDEVIRAANEHGIAMVFTGQRYFRH